MICATCGAEHSTGTNPCPECGESSLLDGSYEIQRVLGSGAAGTTYQATDKNDTSVVIKELDVGKVENLKALELVDREIEALKSIDHPKVPAYVDDFRVREPGSVAIYLVQEYVEGEPLSERDGFSEREALRLIVELCETLEYLHGLRPPVIHRDIKPSNVIRRPDGSFVLVDFGAVRREITREIGGSTVAGTMGYMAPEQYRGVATPASDLYGVGATAVSMFAGRDATEIIDHLEPRGWQSHVDLRPTVTMFLQTLLTPTTDDRADSAAAVASRARGLLEKFEGPRHLESTSESIAAQRDARDDAVSTLASVPEAERSRLRRQLWLDWWGYRAEDVLRAIHPFRGEFNAYETVMGATAPAWLFGLIGGPMIGYGLAAEIIVIFYAVVVPVALLVLWRLAASDIPWWGDYRQGLASGINEFQSAKNDFLSSDDPWAGSKGHSYFDPAEFGLGATIVAEEAARDLAREGNDFEATEALDGAREYASTVLSEDDILHAVMLYRQAPIEYRSAADPARALRDRYRAERLLREAREATGLRTEQLVSRALDEYRVDDGASSLGDVRRAELDGRIRRRVIDEKLFGWFRRRVIRNPLGLIWVSFFLVAMVVAGARAAGTLLGVILQSVSESWGVFEVTRETVTVTTTAVAALVVLVYLATAIYSTYSGRVGTSWKEEWFPDFDQVWSKDHSLRRAFEEAAENAWNFAAENDVLDTIGNRRSELSPEQKTMVRELEAIAHARSQYVHYDGLVENVETVQQHEIRHPQSRLVVLDAAVDGVLRSDADNARSKAREYLARAQNMRERLLIEE